MTRLARVKPFALLETMLPAAAVSSAAQSAIDLYLLKGRRELRSQLQKYLQWLKEPEAQKAAEDKLQERFTTLRMQFNNVLSQFDLFADALTQRSEHDTGVWLSGLDVVAADALTLSGNYYEMPPLICYLDRGPGAAIRRARTRLPGGGENPVAIIRVPRERMIGSGVASSLVHEVGHQGSALLDLIPSLRLKLREMQSRSGENQTIWEIWERWISEILADFWGVARVGVASTLGLIGVVGLPRYFVFRLSTDDPHPIPWIRVKLSCAIGDRLYPNPQWGKLARFWESLYPRKGLDPVRLRLFSRLEESLPQFVELLADHRPVSLGGASLLEVLSSETLQPDRLADDYQAWRASRSEIRRASPTHVFAVMGQARMDGRISPEEEGSLLSKMLTYWALRRRTQGDRSCAVCMGQTLDGTALASVNR